MSEAPNPSPQNSDTAHQQRYRCEARPRGRSSRGWATPPLSGLWLITLGFSSHFCDTRLNLPSYVGGVSVWEALVVVSLKWSFPAPLPRPKMCLEAKINPKTVLGVGEPWDWRWHACYQVLSCARLVTVEVPVAFKERSCLAQGELFICFPDLFLSTL